MNQNSYYVLDYAIGDVTGDSQADQVYLIGTKTSDSPLNSNITLVIEDGMTRESNSISLPINVGYQPSLFLGDMTGDGIHDILISIATGGSGGTYHYFIFSYVNRSAKLIFNSVDYNDQYQYTVNFQDGYKVKVTSLNNKRKYLIDLTYRDPSYLKEIYRKNGELRQPIEGWVDPISGLFPVDYASDHIYELLAYQQVAGRYHADSLGFIQNILKWDKVKERFVMDRQYLAIHGSDLN